MLEGTFIDKIFAAIIEPIIKAMELILGAVLSSKIITAIIWILLINLIAIILMKKDKEYAKEDKRRTKERTLLMVAVGGGSLGIYYSMYKYRHKTLHKKFTIGVPVIMLIQFAIFTYYVITKIA